MRLPVCASWRATKGEETASGPGVRDRATGFSESCFADADCMVGRQSRVYRRSQKGTTPTGREKGEAFGFDDGMGSRRSLAGQSVSEGGMGGGWGQGQGPPLVFPLRSAANRHSNKTRNDAFSRGQGLTEGRGIASTDVLAFIHIRPVLRCTTATMRASGRPRDCDS